MEKFRHFTQQHRRANSDVTSAGATPTTNVAPVQSLISTLAGGQKPTIELRSYSGVGGVVGPQVVPTSPGVSKSQKRPISGPLAADAELLQKFSAEGRNTVQQMLLSASQEYQAFKQEYQKNPSEANHSNLEQQGRIVARLQSQLDKQQQRGVVTASASDTEIPVSPNSSSGFSDLPTSESGSWRAGIDSSLPSTAEGRETHPTGLPPHPATWATSTSGRGRHRTVDPGSGGTGRTGTPLSRMFEVGKTGSSLCRSHSDSYKKRFLVEQNLRASASTDEIEKLERTMTSQDDAKKRYKDSRSHSRSLEVYSDDASDPSSDRLSPLAEQLSTQESFGELFPSASATDIQQSIMSMEDGELSSEDESSMDQGVFASFDQLANRPAHLAVFLHYLISNSDPVPLMFFLVTDSYPTGTLKEMRKWAYEIYSTFLVPGAPLKISVDEAMVESINQTLVNKYDKEEIMKTLFTPVRDVARQEINYLMDDFRSKRKLGLGCLFGDHELKDYMDSASEMRIIEKYLWGHFERFAQEEDKERSLAIGSCLMTFFKHVNYMNTKVSSHVFEQRCPSFNARDKTKLLSKFSTKGAKKVVKGHQFQAQHYYSATYCFECHQIIGGIGFQGFQCIRCEANVHKTCCVDNMKSICTGKKEKLEKDIEKEKEKEKDKEKGKATSHPLLNRMIKRKPSSMSGTQGSARETRETPDDRLSAFYVSLEATDEGELDQSRVSQLVKPADQRQTATLSVIADDSKSASFAGRDRASSHGRSTEGSTTAAGQQSDTHLDVTVTSSIEGGTKFGGSSPSGSSVASHPRSPSMYEGSIVTSELPTLYLQQSPDDPDLLTEAELPSLETVIGKERLKMLKPKQKKRQDVINELFYTERAHVRNLKVMRMLYYLPMRNSTTGEFVNLLFPNLDDMIDIHSHLNDGFKLKREENCVVGDFADILVNSFDGAEGERFKQVCATFCEKQSYALEVLKTRQRKDPKLQLLLQDASVHRLSRRLELKDFLPTAMQRLTKYPLLIDNLLKYTPQDSEEYAKLQIANRCSKDILNHVNKAVQDFENRLRLVELQKKLDKRPIESSNQEGVQEYKNLDLTQYQLLFDGPLTWRIGREKLIPLHAVLLNDVLLLLQKQDDRLVLRCQSMLIAPGNQDTKMTHSPIIRLTNLIHRYVATDKRAFFLVSTSKVGPQIYDLIAGSKDEKNKWCKYITSAVEMHKLSASSSTNAGGGDLNQSSISAPFNSQLSDTPSSGDAQSPPSVVSPDIVASNLNLECIDAVYVPVVVNRATDTLTTTDLFRPRPASRDNNKDSQETDEPLQIMLSDKAHLQSPLMSNDTFHDNDQNQPHQRISDDHAVRNKRGPSIAVSLDVPNRVLTCLTLVNDLMHLVTESPMCSGDPSTPTTPTPAGNSDVDEVNDCVMLPFSPLLDIMTTMREELTNILDITRTKEEENSNLRLEIKLIQKQLDNVCVTETSHENVTDSRPVSVVSASSGDEDTTPGRKLSTEDCLIDDSTDNDCQTSNMQRQLQLSCLTRQDEDNTNTETYYSGHPEDNEEEDDREAEEPDEKEGEGCGSNNISANVSDSVREYNRTEESNADLSTASTTSIINVPIQIVNSTNRDINTVNMTSCSDAHSSSDDMNVTLDDNVQPIGLSNLHMSKFSDA